MGKLNFKGFVHKAIPSLVIVALGLAGLTSLPQKSYALLPVCGGPGSVDNCGAEVAIQTAHSVNENLLMNLISTDMQDFRTWLTDTFFKQEVLPALQKFTEQMSAIAMEQVFMIGTFLDAKQQLETQRLFQELQTQAHKDYHPSEDFCWFGTNVRSLAASEQISKFNAVALDKVQMARQLGNVNNSAAKSEDDDKAVRWDQFTSKFCDQNDNNRIPGTAGTGLQMACPTPTGGKRANIDVNYTRAIDEPRTLDLNFAKGDTSADRENIIALSNNLYGHNVLTRNAFKDYLKNVEYQHLYMALRSVAAKRSVAQNSFDAIVGLKSAGDPGMDGSSTNQFLGAILAELGVPSDDVYKIIGQDPSYYAQLELLAKKIYQSPEFYSNLYDKPANVARKGVALKAIDLMLDRAIFESQIRQEMSTSVLLSARLRGEFRDVNKNLTGAGGG